MAKQITNEATSDRLECDLEPFQLAHEFSRKLEIQKPDFTRYTGTHIGEQSKYVSCRFSDKQAKQWGSVELIHVTDVQHGHVRCNVKREIEYRDWVLSKPNRFMLWGGDNVDAYRVGSPGEPWENWFSPQKQVYQFCQVWAPAAHRILGYVGGNHERRGNAAFGDLGTLIATLLQVPYSGGQQAVDIHFGQHKPFAVHLWHGRGAAQTKGAKINMVHDTMKKSTADLILVGHLHDPMVTFDWKIIRDPNNFTLKLKKQAGAMSSSFLEFFGGYAEVLGMSPSDVMMARAILTPNGKWELTLK